MRMCVLDGNNRAVWQRAFDWPPSTDTRVFGTAYRVEGSNGSGLILEAATTSTSDIPAGSFIVLVPRNGHLQVATPEVRFFGMMEHIPDAGKARRRLRDGDVVMYQFWTGHFYLIRAAQIDFSGGRLIPDCSGRCTFNVKCDASPITADSSVQLFDHPFGASRGVPVTKESKLTYLNAYVEDTNELDSLRESRNGRPWLHIRVDGNEGWVAGPTDLQTIGLSPIARAK
ncbi:MAG: hypothetical protein WCP29_18865 [Acidobacteriota bacterium]